MDNQEFTAWSKLMKAARGGWKVDPVHNGQGRDLILFKASATDHTAGLYITLDTDGTASAGRFGGAVPHIGEALFMPMWTKKFDSYSHGLKTILERAGVSMLLDIAS